MPVHRFGLSAALRTFGEERDVGGLQFRRMTRPKHVEDLVDDAVRVESGLGIHSWRADVIDKDIRQHHAADLEAGGLEPASVAEQFHHLRTQATDRAFLVCDQLFVPARQP
jgi:hypothetical protein